MQQKDTTKVYIPVKNEAQMLKMLFTTQFNAKKSILVKSSTTISYFGMVIIKETSTNSCYAHFTNPTIKPFMTLN